MAQINSIFNFLKEYNELSNPVITQIDKQKWSLKLTNLPQITEVWSVYLVQDFSNDKILEVRRPFMEPCPKPDDTIVDWLIGNWNHLSTELIVYKEKIEGNIENEDGTTSPTELFFVENEERVYQFNEWTKKRDKWRLIELPKQACLELYNNLFKLYSEIKKESESVELILGDGHIRWSTNERDIDHPVLLQKVKIEFDSDKPAFIIKCDELHTELYSPLLRVIPSINQSMLSEVIQEIDNHEYHIADIANTKGLFQRLINVVDEKGKCVDSFEHHFEGPSIMSESVLFLRKRTLGFSTFIDKIIEEIEDNENITLPDFFETMLGNYKEKKESEVIDENWNQSGVDQDILLTLPANNEQLKIVKYLNNYGAVLVQGPPGTGKTHTIANLIGHLLSQGNSVLVTSHTEKALTVLKDKVYKDEINKDINLQNLCISLLSSNTQKKEMDNSLFEIAEKGTSLDLNDSLMMIKRLETERMGLVEKYKAKNQELIQIRSLEYKDIIYSNQTLTPIEAAKFIKNGEGEFDYIPGLTRDDTSGLPLSIEELKALYESNQRISLEEEKLLSKELPSINDIWSVDVFNDERNRYNKHLQFKNDSSTTIVVIDQLVEEEYDELLKETQNILNDLKDMEPFQQALVSISIKDKVYSSFWTTVFKELSELLEKYEQYRKILFEDNINIEVSISDESITILDEMIDSGKEIPVNLMTRLMKPKWKKLQDSININNKVIENRMDYEKIKAIISYELNRNNLLEKISKLLNDVSDKDIIDLNNFEIKVEQLIKKVRFSLNWYEQKWISFMSRSNQYIIDPDRHERLFELDIDQPIESMTSLLEQTLIPNIKYNLNSIYLNRSIQKWDNYASFLETFRRYSNLYEGLYSAVHSKDVEQYSDNYEEVICLYEKRVIYDKRLKWIDKLILMAPDWADFICKREGVHGSYKLPENIEFAWKWRQLSNQIDRIDGYDANELHKDLNKINDYLLKNAQRLAYEKSWFEKIKSKTPAQTQAIEQYRKILGLYGKGYSKNAAKYLQSARDIMPLCQSAIPVWIMPLNRVVENFDPQKNKFDVVIIDEASQADILALSVLYLGKKIIIVGDDEQVSPNSFGTKIDELNALIEQHLSDVPGKILFNDKTSIYDLALSSGFKPLMLTEHFRCLPEIIEFSNQLSYNGKIKPLRDSSGVITKPSVVEYRVPHAYKTARKINPIEAEHIASIIIAAVENSAYENKTIGVISLLGQEQAYEIDRLLQTHLDPKEYEKRRIQCGTAPQFQGDERDIMFLSVVEGPNEKGGPVRLLSEDGRNDINRKRYNVAASRAKDQMWVVHSLNPEIDLKPDDIRLKLIKHAMNPSLPIEEGKMNKAESDFEMQVMKILLNQGYKVNPQWKVGSYRIDMVIEDGNRRIALECDGEKWHTVDDLPNDMKRQAILERLGWTFIRIRGSAFYRNPDSTMKWVFEELLHNGIKPNFNDYKSSNESDNEDFRNDNELISGIKRRAEQIRVEWNNEYEIIIPENKENHEEGTVELTEVEVATIDEVSTKKEMPSYEKEQKRVNQKSNTNKGKISKRIVNDVNRQDVQKPLFDFRKNQE